jgi:hypothetical protein
MRILRLSAFFVFAIIECISAQGSQTTSNQQPSATQVPDKSPPQPQPAASPNQNSQTKKDQQLVTPAAKPFKFRFLPSKPAPDEKKLPTGFLDRGFRASVVPGAPDLKKSNPRQSSARPRLEILGEEGSQFLAGNPQGRSDRGIYAASGIPGARGICGSILSYNFSQAAAGEMPNLESVTTCTPSETVVPRRAHGRHSQPRGPQLIETLFRAQ